MCSQKFKDCIQEKRNQWMQENKDEMKADSDNKDCEERKEGMKRFKEKVVSYLDVNYLSDFFIKEKHFYN